MQISSLGSLNHSVRERKKYIPYLINFEPA